MDRALIVLPARLHSTRLPRKLLRVVAGKTVLHHTYLAACQCPLTQFDDHGQATNVIVAVDDQEVADQVEQFGGRWVMTSPLCPSGTDRIAEVAARFPDIDTFINVQGDEPELDPNAILAVGKLLLDHPDADMATAGTPITDAAALGDPGIVKIVLADYQEIDADRQADSANPSATLWPQGQGRAVYFSRACVPHDRQGPAERLLDHQPPLYWHHLGLYAYRREFLKWFSQSPTGSLEATEKLEQLRAIEAGKRILVARVGPAQPGIDTEADLERFRHRAEG